MVDLLLGKEYLAINRVCFHIGFVGSFAEECSKFLQCTEMGPKLADKHPYRSCA